MTWFSPFMGYAHAAMQQATQDAQAIAAAQNQARLAEMAAQHMFKNPGDIIDVEARVIEDAPELEAPLKQIEMGDAQS